MATHREDVAGGGPDVRGVEQRRHHGHAHAPSIHYLCEPQKKESCAHGERQLECRVLGGVWTLSKPRRQLLSGRTLDQGV